MSDFQAKLKKFSKTFKTAKEKAKETGFGAELPDGRYLATLTEVELGESKASSRLQLTFVYKITEGENKGETLRKFVGIETEDDQVWLARELLRFGIQIENLEELPEVIKILNKSEAEVKVSLKTKDSGQFLYLDKVLSEIDADDFAAESEEETEDEDEGEEEDDTDEVVEEEETDDDDDTEEEEEVEEDDEEGVSPEVGMTVSFVGKSGKAIEGKIIKILEDENAVKVKSGDKTFTVGADKLSIVENEEEVDEDEEVEEDDEEVKPVKKTVKKTVAKKTAKKK